METRNVYHLSLKDRASFARSRRIGLLRERTGIPLFLLYLKSGSSEGYALHSAEDVESHIYRSTHDQDKNAWRLILPFFEAEGTSAYAFTSPLGSDSTTHFESILGIERGFQQGTGIQAAKHWREHADLLCLPQASSLFPLETLLGLYQALFPYLEAWEHFFLLMDLPKYTSIEALESCRGLHSPDAALYYPWITKDCHVFPPSPLAAAVFQKTDNDNIQDLPANRPLFGGFRPIQTFAPGQLRSFLEKRLNVVHEVAAGDVRIWGAQTLASSRDEESKYISTRRTMMAMKEAIQELCEPFVLEPLHGDLPKIVDVALQSAFQPLRRIFDNTVREPFHARVQVTQKGGDDILEINIRFCFPFALDEITFSLDLTG